MSLFMTRAQLIGVVKGARACLIEGSPNIRGDKVLLVPSSDKVLTMISLNVRKLQWGFDPLSGHLIGSVPEKWGVKDTII